VDIRRINGIPVQGLETSTAPGAQRAREAAANLEKWAKENPNVNQFIGPNGGWSKNTAGKFAPITNDLLLNQHKNHFHINVFRK
jgi:hypothetical protein